MRFERKDNYNDDNIWFKETIGAEFNKLSDDERQRINRWLDGDTNRMINPKKFKDFISSIILLKDFFHQHTSKYEMDINQKKGIVTILSNKVDFYGSSEVKEALSKAKNITIEVGKNSMTEFVIEYDIMSELR